MHGHQPLIDLRMRGRRPAFGARVSTDETEAAWPGIHAAMCARMGVVQCPVEVYIAPSDNLRRLDLRPFVGLVVHVDGMDPQRVRDVCQALHEAGAKRVVGAAPIQRGAAAITAEVTQFGPEGVLSWPA